MRNQLASLSSCGVMQLGFLFSSAACSPPIRPIPGAHLAIIIPHPAVSFFCLLIPWGALASPHSDSTVAEGLTSETSPLIAISALQPPELCYGADCSLPTAAGCYLIHYYAIPELVYIVFREGKRCLLLKTDLDPINSSSFSNMLHHVPHSHHSPHPSRPCLQGDPLVGAVLGLVACQHFFLLTKVLGLVLITCFHMECCCHSFSCHFRL